MSRSLRSPTPRRQERGVSLVELMIGIAIGLVIVAGGLVVFGTSARGSTETLRAARLNQDLATASQIIANEIRRAGFRRGGSAANAMNPIQILEDGACVIYAFDENGDGVIGAVERRGFRFASGVLWIANPATTPVNGSCANINQPLTDPAVVTITALNLDTRGSKCRNLDGNGYWQTVEDATEFPCGDTTMSNLRLCGPDATCATSPPTARVDLVSAGDRLAESRRVNIRIAGRLTNDSTVTKALATSVTIANTFLTQEPQP